MKQLKRLGQRGDTIVEVMIVLAVLGLALSISYATANSSLLATRAAQENSIAGQLLRTQVENIRTLAPTTLPGQGVFQSVPYCLKSESGTYVIKTDIDDDCQFDNIPYTVEIWYTGPTGQEAGTFKLSATWDNVQGEGRDSVTLLYRADSL